MTKRVRIIKRNQRSYIVYRRLHNYRLRLNPFTGRMIGLADIIYQGQEADVQDRGRPMGSTHIGRDLR